MEDIEKNEINTSDNKKQPTKKYFDNLLDSRKILIKEIIRNIEINTDFEDESYRIGLYGTYGSGKSYFLNSFKEFTLNKEIQDKCGFETNNKFKIIEINAWKEDYLQEPILSIGLSILDQIKEDGIKEKNIESIRKNILNITKNILPFVTKTGINILLSKIGINNKVLSDFNEYVINKDFLDGLSSDLNIDYENYKKYLKEIQEGLTKYVEELKKDSIKLIILVDELDRCRPDYAIEFLEAVNHIFNVKGLTFLFAIDNNSLHSAFTTIYGTKLNFDNYIKKFIDTVFILDAKNEHVDKDKYIKNKMKEYNLLNFFSKKYININTKNNHSITINFTTEDICYIFNKVFKLELRDINFVLRILRHYIDKNNNKNEENNNNYIFYLYSILFLSSLKTKDSNSYQQLFSTQKSKYIDINLPVLNEILKIYDIKEGNKNIIIFLSIFNNIEYVSNYDCYSLFTENKNYKINDLINDFMRNLKYDNFNNILLEDEFYNIITDNKEGNNYYWLIAGYQNYTKTKNINKSILRQCYEMIY